MTKLQRETVINAALALLDDVGADGLTTRKLAERLNVQQPALYWHFSSKQHLLDALAEAMLRDNHTHSAPAEGEYWQDFLRANAHSFRKALLSHRDGARIHAGTRPGNSHFASIEAQLQLLCSAGFSAPQAASALVTISHYVVGAALEQQAQNGVAMPTDRAAPLLAKAIKHIDQSGPDAAFEFGLAVIIDGLAATLARSK